MHTQLMRLSLCSLSNRFVCIILWVTALCHSFNHRLSIMPHNLLAYLKLWSKLIRLAMWFECVREGKQYKCHLNVQNNKYYGHWLKITTCVVTHIHMCHNMNLHIIANFGVNPFLRIFINSISFHARGFLRHVWLCFNYNVLFTDTCVQRARL